MHLNIYTHCYFENKWHELLNLVWCTSWDVPCFRVQKSEENVDDRFIIWWSSKIRLMFCSQSNSLEAHPDLSVTSPLNLASVT